MSQYDDIIQTAAQKWNVDPALIRGVIATESTGNPHAVSPKGATGLMQIEPSNYASLGITDPNDPKQNIMGGTQLLSQLLDRYGDVQTALTHYVGGDDPKKWGPQTAAYPQKVLTAAGIGAPQVPQQSQTMPGIPSTQAMAQPASGADPFSSLAVAGSSAAAPHAAPQETDAFSSLPVAGASATQPGKQQTPAQPAGDKPGTLESAVIGFGKGIGNTVAGTEQLLGKGASAVGLGGLGNYLTNDAAWQLGQIKSGAAPAEAAHPIATGAGNLAGSVAATAPLALAAPEGAGLMTLAGRGAISGAAMGAVSPVDPNNPNFAQAKLGQIGTGAALGVAAPFVASGIQGIGRYAGDVIGSALQPFTSGGQQAIAQNILARAAQSGPTALNMGEMVPGSIPTLAEATANPGIATLQRTIRDVNPNPFVAQEQQNAASRLAQLGAALGTPQELEAAQVGARQVATDLGGAVASNGVGPTPALNAILSRPAMAPILRDAETTAQNMTGANPFQTARDALAAQRVAQYQGIAGSPQALQAAVDARETAANALYSQANAETFPMDSTLKGLLARPSMQQAVARAQKLASETGQPLKEGIDLPAQMTSSTILGPDGQPAFSVSTPASQSTFSGRALNYIKMGLDDIIGSGSQTGGIVGHEKSALNDTKADLLNWMDAQSPIYQQARQTYAQMSSPINSMETLQGLNLTDATGAIVPSKLDSAIKSIQSAQAEHGINAAKSVTPQQLSALSGLLDTINADRAAPIPSNLGPEAVGHIQTAITNALNSGKVLPPETQSALLDAQNEILNTLRQQNPQAIGARVAPSGTAAGNFMGPITVPQQAAMQATSARSLGALQGMNLTDASGNVTLAKVQNALKSLQKQGLVADPEKMTALVSLRDDLLRATNTGLGKSAGSATAQNLATQNMVQSALPGKLGAMVGKLPAGTIGGTIGTGLGYMAGGPLGATIGSGAGAFLGRTLGGLANASNDAIQGHLTDMLLNPSLAGPALNRIASPALPFAARPVFQRLGSPAIINTGLRLLNSPERP